jgi:hypothetical protein
MGTATVMYDNSEICRTYHNFILNLSLKHKKFYLMKPINNKLFYYGIVFYFRSVRFNKELQTRRYHGNMTEI